MLLRIDIYPDNDKAPAQTLFVSPATVMNRESSSDNDNVGRLLSIGRKDCEVLFDKEKSVSRKHAVLRCVSINRKHNERCCMKATTEEEIRACEENPLNMCLVLENIGKGGSFIIQPERTAADGKKPGKNDQGDGNDDATDDETDDEGVSQPISQALSTATGGGENMAVSAKEFYGNQALTISRLEVGDKKVISFEGIMENTIFVQFAISPSRPTIRITWLPFYMVCSSTVPATIKSSLYLGGGVVTEGLPDQTSTHVVSKEYSPVAKQLIAWCLGIPIVSPDFCKALIERKNITDPLPDPKNYAAAKAEGFFLEKPSPKLFSKFEMLSLVPKMEDMERLAEVAGAKVVRLYDMFTNEADIVKHVQSLVEERQKATTNKTSKISVVFALSANKKGAKAKMTLFNKIMELGIPATNIKEVARAITEQSCALQDIHRNVISGSEEEDYEVEGEDGGNKSMEQQEPLDKDECIKETDAPVLRREKGQSRAKSEEKEKATLSKDSSPKRRRVAQSPKHFDPVSEDRDPQKEKAPMPQHTSPVPARPRPSPSHMAQLEGADPNGWFAAAPKDDTKRKEFRKKASQALVNEGGIGLERAATTAKHVHIITPTEISPSDDAQTSYHRTKRSLVFGRLPRPVTGGPDFKRFRKNYTAPVDPEDVVVLVDFVSEKTQKQREMNEQAQKLEDEQKEADALFRGIGTGGLPKKRRRKD
ncbi:hypothetical protein IV203_034891 [Nitzschia inconspicua]|uniref:FHA domain-containing protein n=1 Tax=Nitzschia inconspicua TaxID=303405 RepID=A0A9K3LE21_9STRA|nr:hypothetical protein IV203_034891 [Nitzschia inconspicua]